MKCYWMSYISRFETGDVLIAHKCVQQHPFIAIGDLPGATLLNWKKITLKEYDLYYKQLMAQQSFNESAILK